MDWFQRLTGFEETNYADTREKLAVEGQRLKSLVNGRSYGIGELELVSLEELRPREVCCCWTVRQAQRFVGQRRRPQDAPAA